MRAKYLNKTARRRSIRPDGGNYRELRKMRGGKGRAKFLQWVGLIVCGLAIAWILYALFLRR
ncbi:MAG TPA: hypothetical protein PLD59_09510 [Tepidisphaeraceae bacterium]|nr:hypothetical protein [Tepidisphaeraceae bacterium]